MSRRRKVAKAEEGMNLEKIVQAIQLIEDDRNISKEIIFEALQESLIKGYRREIDVPDAQVTVELDSNGNIRLYHEFTVVEEVEDDALEVGLNEIENNVDNLVVGDILRIEKSVMQLGRAAVTLAKNVIMQKIREAEKAGVYNEYYRQLDDMVIAKVESVEDKFIVLDLGKALAIMPRSAQMRNEHYTEGQTIKVVITEVNKESKGAQILVSRASDMMVRRLFEREVPEFSSNLVEIKAMAREAGDRTKVAVFSNDPNIDPIGAFVGHQGSRIQAVRNELSGENIDVFEWSSNMIELVQNALSPAEVVAVIENPNGHGLMVIVDKSELSLAIGKGGKNARLAVRLTKEAIDIKSVDEAVEKGIDYISLQAAYEAKLRAQEIERLAKKEVVEEIVEDVAEEVVEDIVDEVVTEVAETVEDTVEEVIEEDVEVTKEVVEPIEKVVEVPKRKRPLLKPRTEEYVSKFEEIADASRKQEEDTRRRRYNRRKDEIEIVSTSEMLKEMDYEILPEYSDDELEEIKAQTQANEEEWYDDDIDFDLYDDYYDEE